MTNGYAFTYNDAASRERAKKLLARIYPESDFIDGPKYWIDLENAAYVPGGSHGPKYAEVERLKEYVVNNARRKREINIVASKYKKYFKRYRENAVMVFDVMKDDGKTPMNKFLVINGDDIADNCKEMKLFSKKGVNIDKENVELYPMPYRFVKEY